MLVSWLVGALLLGGCKAPPVSAPTASAPSPAVATALPVTLDRALAAESHDALAAEGYLLAIDQASANWNDPWAAPVVAAALDHLVWPGGELGERLDHALVHRSRERLVEVTSRLLAAHRRVEGHPILGPMVAFSLHELALQVGAEREAADLRRRAGCIPEAAAFGPLAWPMLTSLDDDLGLPSHGAMPNEVRGVPPFASTVRGERSYGDACALDFAATGALGGLRALVFDVVVPKDDWIYVAVGTRSAIRLDLGGETLLRRTGDLTGGTTLSFARAWLPAGRARVVLRVAHAENDEPVTVQLVDGQGGPLATVVPAPGEIAASRASRATTIELVPEPSSPEEVISAASAELALGLDRRAARRLESSAVLPTSPPAHLDLLRLRAYRVAEERSGPALDADVRALAARARSTCPTCWNARIADAYSAYARVGAETGPFAALERLGVKAPPAPDSTDRAVPELAFIASMADAADLRDVTRGAMLALARKAPGSGLLARVDDELAAEGGAEAVTRKCEGGLSRGTTDCLMANLARDDLDGMTRELARLRRLRGSPASHRRLELAKLVSRGETERAARLYEAMPEAMRDTAVLALLPREEGQRRLARDWLTLSDTPYGLEPLVRLLGVALDPAAELEAEGAALVARDRASAFLPGAGTAVLRHVERYDVGARGLLRYWTYDLRRVSDTEDVASRAEADAPAVLGRWTSRTLRRKIHKRDGRVLDPDPNAVGSQGHTDLSQLEKGDYVEQLTVGWALPEEHGQLVVDTPDAMPERTSVRDLEVELTRPAHLPMKLWSHALLGPGSTETREGRLRTVWRLQNQAPRRLERDVPAFEAQVGISFGTDDHVRIGRAIGEHVRVRESADPFVTRWVAKTLGPAAASLDPLARLARLTSAVGKKVRVADPHSFGDYLATVGGRQADSARTILERGSGSRTWVLHRALREAGIDSAIAVAETQSYSASPNFPVHVGRFTHPLIRANLGGSTVWIDADVEGPPLPPGRVSPALRGRLALLTDGTMVPVEASSADDADGIAIALELDARGNATGTFRAVIHGQAAQQMAGALETLVGEKRTHLLRGIVQGWVPWADVRDVALSSGEGSWQVEVSARLETASFALPDDRDGATWSLPGLEPFHAIVPEPASSSLTSRYVGQADRESALAIDTPLFYRVVRTVKLPPGTRLDALPPALDVTGADLAARRSVERRGDTLEERFELSLPLRVVQPDELDAFVAKLHAVDDGFAHATRAALQGETAKAVGAAKKPRAKGPAPKPTVGKAPRSTPPRGRTAPKPGAPRKGGPRP
ncbi:MAG: hypothetical protein FJ096_06145 [Deltaproteobacteria bacterium]|nr:hypothetical protein [Deltaproteobacteria bacterium]